MKKLFTIIAVASMMLTTVLGFTSCQKDEMPAQSYNTNTTNNNSNASQSSSTQNSEASQQSGYSYFGYQMFVNDEVLALGDFVVTVSYDGKTTEYKASEGQSASIISANFIEKGGAKATYTGKTLVVPTFNANSKSASVSVKFVQNDAAVSSLDQEGGTDIFVICNYMGSKTNNISIDATSKKCDMVVHAGTYYMSGYKAVFVGLTNTKVISALNRKANLFATDFK